MQNNADLALNSKIDQADYDEASLIEIRVPLNAPYLIDGSAEFERYDGELELHGVHYNYVKRKVVNGELVLLCLPNETKTELQNSRVEFFKLVNDLNHSQTKGKSSASSFKSVTTEYKQENNSWSVAPLLPVHVTYASANTSFIEAGHNLIPEHPPKA